MRIHFDSSVVSLSALSDALGDDVILPVIRLWSMLDADNNPVTDSFVDGHRF